MRKLICIILSMTMLLSFSGCGQIIDFFQEQIDIEQQSEEIVRCFDEKDVEGLKNLFCQHSKQNYDIDSQIIEMFEYYEGICISDYSHYISVDEASHEKGVCVKRVICSRIQNVVTSEGKEYNIEYSAYIKYDKDPKRIGIYAIYLTDSERNLITKIKVDTWSD